MGLRNVLTFSLLAYKYRLLAGEEKNVKQQHLNILNLKISTFFHVSCNDWYLDLDQGFVSLEQEGSLFCSWLL